MSHWLQVHVEVPEEGIETVTGVYEKAGALSVTVSDAGNAPVYEPLPGEIRVWPHNRVTGLFEGTIDMQPLQAALSEALGGVPEGWRIEGLADRDWVRAWLDDYRPMRFGTRLWVCPTDHAAPDPTAVNLRLDPGLAFGTGTHPTTALCLEWLATTGPVDRLLDYGCGSGILAIAALLLGSRSGYAVDIDPQALTATRSNAAINGIIDRLDIGLPEELGDAQRFDLVLANILSGPLVELAPSLAERLMPGGTLVLSGLLEEQIDGVAAAYRPYLTPFTVELRDGWARMAAHRA